MALSLIITHYACAIRHCRQHYLILLPSFQLYHIRRHLAFGYCVVPPWYNESSSGAEEVLVCFDEGSLFFDQ